MNNDQSVQQPPQSSTPGRQRVPKDPSGTLNVFLHGLTISKVICIKESGRCHEYLDIHLPNLGVQHCYRYGEFLGEVTLPPSPSPYWVRNIDGGSTTFDPKESLVVNAPLCRNPDIYATIRFPLSKKIYYMLQVDLTDVLEDPQSVFQTPRIMTMVPVLVYTFRDFRRILFGGEPLRVAPIVQDGSSYLNLHIFAEEDQDSPESHTIAGFDKALRLFEIPVPPRLASLGNVAPPPLPIKNLPRGTTRIEFTDLPLRNQALGYLGRVLREELLHQRPLSFVHTSAVCADPKRCGHIAG